MCFVPLFRGVMQVTGSAFLPTSNWGPVQQETALLTQLAGVTVIEPVWIGITPVLGGIAPMNVGLGTQRAGKSATINTS